MNANKFQEREPGRIQHPLAAVCWNREESAALFWRLSEDVPLVGDCALRRHHPALRRNLSSNSNHLVCEKGSVRNTNTEM